jgi:hypothetical protein
VTHLADNDTNYHVFYYLLAGANADLRSRLQLQQRTANDFRYLLPQAGNVPSARQGFENDAGMFQELLEAFRVCGVSDEERGHIFDILGAILHLGNCEFVFVKEAKRLAPSQRPVLGTVARLLQVDPTTLEKALTTRLLGSKSRASTYSVPLDAAGVAEARESVARVLYNSLFHWLVERINRMLSANHAIDDRFVAILDIFGFENFAHNSFEQLLINYANEKLHDSFLESVFREEQRTYEAEGLQWQSVSFEDNSACLTLLEQRPSGILALLDEECLLPTGSDDGYLRKAETLHAQSRHFGTPRVNRNARAERGFVIKHFADDVTYAVADFVEKNQDRLHADLVIALQSSKNPFICAIVNDDIDEGVSRATTVRRATSTAGGAAANNGGLPANARKRPTQATMFRSQLDELCRMIQSVDRHFIRCVKPNASSTPGYIDEPMLRAQLRYTGVVAAARVRAAGYALRLPFGEFVERFKSTTAAELAGLDGRAASIAIAQSVCSTALSPRGGGGGDLFQIGRTRVFLKQTAVDLLEEARLRLRKQLAVEVQCAMRAALARSRFEVAQADHRRRIAEERERLRREEEERLRREEEERLRREEEERRRRDEEQQRRRREEEEQQRRRREEEEQWRRRDEEEQRRRREDDERRMRDSSARVGDRSPVTSQRQDDIYVGLPQKFDAATAAPPQREIYDPVPQRESFAVQAVLAQKDKSNYSSAPRSQSLAVRGGAIRAGTALEYVQLGPEDLIALEREAQYTIIPPEDDDDDGAAAFVAQPSMRRGLFEPPPPPQPPAADLQYVIIAPEDDAAPPPQSALQLPTLPPSQMPTSQMPTSQMPPPAPSSQQQQQPRWQNAINDVLNDLQYVVMPPEEVLTTLVPDQESFDLQYVVMPPEEVSSPQSGRSPRSGRGFEMQYIIMPPEDIPTRATPSDIYVSAPGRPAQALSPPPTQASLRVYDTEEGAPFATISLPSSLLARDAMAELGRLFSVDDHRRFGLFMTQSATTPPIKVRLDDDMDVCACYALLCTTIGGASTVRAMFLENARFAGTANLWGRDSPPPALASAWAMLATASAMPAGGAGGSIGRPRLKRTVVNKNLGDDERVGTMRAPSSARLPNGAMQAGGVYGAIDVAATGAPLNMPSSPPPPLRSLSPSRAMTSRAPPPIDLASARMASPPMSPERSLSPTRSRPGPRPTAQQQVSPRRDRGFSEPEAPRPVMKRPTEPTVMRSGRSLYTSNGDQSAMAGQPMSPPSSRATLAKKQVVIGNQVHLIDQVPPSPEPHRRRDNSVPAISSPMDSALADGSLSPRRSDSVPANAAVSPRPGEMLASIRDRYGLSSAPADELLSALVESKFIRCTPRNSSLVIKAGSLRGSMLMLFADVLLFGDPTTEIRALQVAECVVTPGVGTDYSCRIGNGSPDGDIRLQFENENERHVWVATLAQACTAAREREPVANGGDAAKSSRTRGRTLKSMLTKGGNASGDLLTSVTADWRALLEQCRENVGPTTRPWHLVVAARLHALCLALTAPI